MKSQNLEKSTISGVMPLLVKFLKYGVVLAAIGYLVYSGKLDPVVFKNAFRHPLPVIIGIILSFIPMMVSFIRYHYLLKALDINLGMREVIRLGFIGCFFNTFMLGGMGGDVVKVAYIMKDTGKRAPVIASALIDRVLGMLGMLALGGGAMLIALEKVIGTPTLHKLAISVFTALGIVCCCALCCILTLARGRLWGLVAWLLLLVVGAFAVYRLQHGVPFIPVQHPGEDIAYDILLRSRFSVAVSGALFSSLLSIIIVPSLLPGHRLEKFVSSRLPGGKMLMGFIHALLLYRNSLLVLLGGFALSLVTHGFNMSSLYFYAEALELPNLPSISDIFFAAPVAFVANSLPLPGGGLGVGEGAFGYLLSLCTTYAGVAITGGASVFLLWRFWYIVLGLIGLPFYLRGKKEIIAAEEDYKEHEEEIAGSLD